MMPVLTRTWTEPAGVTPQNVTAVPAARVLADVTFDLVTTREQFDQLEGDWNALFDRAGQSAQLFQAFNWNWHWANHFLSSKTGCRLAIITGRRNGRLVTVWPLVVSRLHGLRVVSWMGQPVSQYGDVLVEAGPQAMGILRAAYDFLLATVKPDVLQINKTRDDAAIAPLLAERNALVMQRMEAPYMDLASAPTFAAYEERYSSKARKNRRRQARRLEEQGCVSIDVHQAGEQAATFAAEAIGLKRRWLAQKGLVSPALADDRTLAFFKAAARDQLRPVAVEVATLTCGGTLAAADIAFRCRDRIAVHVLVYDMAFEKAAAGSLLIEAMLARRKAQGIATYDLMAPGDSYKKEWADGSVGVCDYALPLTTAGWLYAQGYLGVIRPRLKAAIARLPAGLRRQLAQRMTSFLPRQAAPVT